MTREGKREMKGKRNELSLTYTGWRLTKMSGCQMLGRGVGSRVVGILTSQGILMIGNWKRWRACSENCILW